MCNPRLAELLTQQAGSDAWVTDLTQLANLADKAEDKNLLRELIAIKQANKRDFANWVKDHQGAEVNPDSIFDVQIKRLHEYKRQLMNALYVLDLYFRIKDQGETVPKRTFIFGAKAAPGYERAKAIIKLINSIAELVNNDPDTKDIIRVVFVENYNVSPAEHIIPAADISEQISVAGKEASGTSNMKFMMNGALTLGTMDGANVEIVEAVGEDNAYIFGARNEELPALRAEYNPRFSMVTGSTPRTSTTSSVTSPTTALLETAWLRTMRKTTLLGLRRRGSISAIPAASPLTGPSRTTRTRCGRSSPPRFPHAKKRSCPSLSWRRAGPLARRCAQFCLAQAHAL